MIHPKFKPGDRVRVVNCGKDLTGLKGTVKRRSGHGDEGHYIIVGDGKWKGEYWFNLWELEAIQNDS